MLAVAAPQTGAVLRTVRGLTVGSLAALLALGEAATRIGEDDEAERIADFLHQSDPTAAGVLSGGIPLGEIAAG